MDSANLRTTVNSDTKTGHDHSQRRTYVYMVECSDGSYYTGLAKDVRERLSQHNSGKGAKYTRSRQPVRLVHVESCKSLSEAMKREHQIKQMRRAQKESLVQSGMELPREFGAQ